MNRNERYILFSGIIIAASLYAYQFMEQPIGLGMSQPRKPLV